MRVVAQNETDTTVPICSFWTFLKVAFLSSAATQLPSAALPASSPSPAPAPAGSATALQEQVEALESRAIAAALEQADGSKPRAAALLQISERTLWYKLKKYRMQ